MNWQDVYRRYEAGVWAVPLALLPSFVMSAVFGQPSCLEPLIDLVIAHTPLVFAHVVLSLLGPLARPLALLGSVALVMPFFGLLSVVAPPVFASRPYPPLNTLRWFMLIAIVVFASLCLAFLAETQVSGCAAMLAGVVFVPILRWTRTWRYPQRKGPQRRKLLRMVLGGPLVTSSLIALASYEYWRNLAVRLSGLSIPVRQLFSFVVPRPRQPGFPVNGTEPEVTPVPQFYINGKNVTDPLLLPQDWELRVTGLVRNPLILTYTQLLTMPRTNLYATLRCVDNPVDGHLMSTAYWSGVRLSDLLALAQPLSAATTIVFHAADQYTEPFALAEPSYENALLAYAMNGETLTQVHGAPLRVLLPGWYGFRNIKWLQEIELVAGPVDGYWEHNGWQAKKIHAVARIDVTQRMNQTHILVAGVAFGGLRGVSKVQVRVNTGPWIDTVLNTPALSGSTWVQWRVLLPMVASQIQLTARMIDSSGVPQEEQAHDPYPDGSSGLHTIEVKL